MEPAFKATIVCPACNTEMAPNATNCDSCGAAAQAVETSGADQKKSGGLRKYIDNPWVILAFMFGAAMVLGLPFLWKSRGFSTLGKVFWTIVVTLYTILVFWLVWQLMQWCWGRIAPVFGTLF